jgi:phenylacetate-CoA ligase
MAKQSTFFSRIETEGREVIREAQLKKLNYIISEAYINTQFYRKIYDEAKVKPEDLETLDDLRKFPIITEDMIREEVKRVDDSYAGMLCVPEDKVYRAAPSVKRSWTSPPYSVALTHDDFLLLTNLLSRMWLSIGMRHTDTAHVSIPGCYLDYSLYLYSMRQMGVLFIPADGVFDALRTVQVTDKLKPYAIVGEVENIPAFVETARKSQLEPQKIFPCYKLNIFKGALTPKLSKRFEGDGFTGEHYNLYQNVDCSFYSIDCSQHAGLHVMEDYYIVEAIDKDTKEPVAPGGKGLLTITNLTVRAVPFVRFQTSDFVEIIEDRCNCGSNFARFRFVRG